MGWSFFFFFFSPSFVPAPHTSSWANPLKDVTCLQIQEMVKDREVWRAAVHGVTVRQDWATEQQLAYREHHPIFGLREEGRLLFLPELWGPLSHLWTLASGWTSPGCCSGLQSWDVWEVQSQAASSLPLPPCYLDIWKKYDEDQLTPVMMRVVEECQVHALRLCSFPSCERLWFGEMTMRWKPKGKAGEMWPGC